jgi:hypothetical protein
VTTLSELLLASFYRNRTNSARAQAATRAVLKAVAEGGVTDLDTAIAAADLDRLDDVLDGTLVYRPPGDRTWHTTAPKRGTA